MSTPETECLRFEPIGAHHADAFFKGLQDERIYEFINEERPSSVEALRDRYQMLSTQLSPDQSELWLNWALWSFPEQQYVGYVQATVRESSTEIAYVLFPSAWGRAYAREAVATMVQHLRQIATNLSDHQTRLP